MPKSKINATNRQRVAAKLIAQNLLEKKGMKQHEIVRRAGYSKSVQTNPAQVTRSSTVVALLNEYIPIDSITKKHKELLESGDLKTEGDMVKLGYKVWGLGEAKSTTNNIESVQIDWPAEVIDVKPVESVESDNSAKFSGEKE